MFILCLFFLFFFPKSLNVDIFHFKPTNILTVDPMISLVYLYIISVICSAGKSAIMAAAGRLEHDLTDTRGNCDFFQGGT